MKKSAIFGAVIVVIALAAGGLLLAGSGSKGDDTKTTTTDTTNMKMDDSSNDTSAAVATDSVAIKDFAFSPANITVKVGTKVTWTNQDSAAHTVTSDTDSTDGGLNSESLAQDESYSATFSKAGTFKYHCAFHSSMTGTVTVTE
jgi:plastocyanin